MVFTLPARCAGAAVTTWTAPVGAIQAAVLGEGVVDLPRVFHAGRSELRSSREALAIRDAPASPRGVSSFVFVVTCNNPPPYSHEMSPQYHAHSMLCRLTVDSR